MVSLIMLLLGIGLAIVKTNNILVIQDWIIYVCFGVAGITLLWSIFNFFSVKKQVKKRFKRF